jgi:hypothetical protein
VSHTTPGYTFFRRTHRPGHPSLKSQTRVIPTRPPLAFSRPWPRRPRRRRGRQLPRGRPPPAPALAASLSRRPSPQTAVVTAPPPTKSSVRSPLQFFIVKSNVKISEMLRNLVMIRGNSGSAASNKPFYKKGLFFSRTGYLFTSTKVETVLLQSLMY